MKTSLILLYCNHKIIIEFMQFQIIDSYKNILLFKFSYSQLKSFSLYEKQKI
jgi:hypothetical protein